MSNLPPGVTGREWQIAGPDSETDETRTVPCESIMCNFHDKVEGVTVGFDGSFTFDWTCPDCGREQSADITSDVEDEHEPDPDQERDDYFDRDAWDDYPD